MTYKSEAFLNKSETDIEFDEYHFKKTDNADLIEEVIKKTHIRGNYNISTRKNNTDFKYQEQKVFSKSSNKYGLLKEVTDEINNIPTLENLNSERNCMINTYSEKEQDFFLFSNNLQDFFDCEKENVSKVPKYNCDFFGLSDRDLKKNSTFNFDSIPLDSDFSTSNVNHDLNSSKNINKHLDFCLDFCGDTNLNLMEDDIKKNFENIYPTNVSKDVKNKSVLEMQNHQNLLSSVNNTLLENDLKTPQSKPYINFLSNDSCWNHKVNGSHMLKSSSISERSTNDIYTKSDSVFSCNIKTPVSDFTTNDFSDFSSRTPKNNNENKISSTSNNSFDKDFYNLKPKFEDFLNFLNNNEKHSLMNIPVNDHLKSKKFNHDIDIQDFSELKSDSYPSSDNFLLPNFSDYTTLNLDINNFKISKVNNNENNCSNPITNDFEFVNEDLNKLKNYNFLYYENHNLQPDMKSNIGIGLQYNHLEKNYSFTSGYNNKFNFYNSDIIISKSSNNIQKLHKNNNCIDDFDTKKMNSNDVIGFDENLLNFSIFQNTHQIENNHNKNENQFLPNQTLVNVNTNDFINYSSKINFGDKKTINSQKSYSKRKHKCEICSARFLRPEHVKRHMKCHSLEKPYKCHVENCSKKFNRKDNLKTHLKNIHKLVNLN